MDMAERKISFILRCFKDRLEAQVFMEFVISFFLLLVFVVLTTVVFVWFSNHLVNRHVEYEKTRIFAGNANTAQVNVGFYNQSKTPLNVFEGW